VRCYLWLTRPAPRGGALLSAGKNSQTFKGHSGPVVCLQFQDPKREILSGSRDTTLKVWDARTLKCITTLSGHRDWIRCLQFDPANATAYRLTSRSLCACGVWCWCARRYVS
jgi:WD40 repeat protein